MKMLNTPIKTSKLDNVLQETPEFGRKSSKMSTLVDSKN